MLWEVVIGTGNASDLAMIALVRDEDKEEAKRTACLAAAAGEEGEAYEEYLKNAEVHPYEGGLDLKPDCGFAWIS